MVEKHIRKIEIETTAGSYIDTVHEELCQMAEEQNNKDKKCYYIYSTTFNGQEIDSTMTIDEVYHKLGINKNKETQNSEETKEKERLKNIEDMKVYYFRLTAEQQKRFKDIDWDKIVKNSIYCGRECVAALHIVSMFNAYRTISDIKDYCDFEGFSGYAWQIVVNLIRELDLDISYRISDFY